MTRRGLAAVGIVVLWAGGLAALVRRTYFKPDVARLAEAGLRVSPAAVYFAVEQHGQQVGFASSTVDTAGGNIDFREYLVADVLVDGKPQRVQSRTTVDLTRTMRVRTFETSMESDSAPRHAGGRVDGDSVIVFATWRGSGPPPPDSQRVRIDGPVLLPSLVPLAIALGEEPRVGNSYVLPVFDPSTMTPRDARIRVTADSTFVVHDSAVMDAKSGRWDGVTPDTLKALQLASDDVQGIAGWMGPQGRLIAATRMGFQLVRRPYEVAYENWRLNGAPDRATTRETRGGARIIESTIVAAQARPGRALEWLRVRVQGLEAQDFRVTGGRQTLRGDTLTIVRERRDSLPALFFPGVPRPREAQDAVDQSSGVESRNRAIRRLATRISGGVRDPREATERILRWVHDSVQSQASTATPDALTTLRTRKGDVADRTQLFLALARATNLPARAAVGLLDVNGTFYFHAWPEVYIGGWVPADPTLDQFPADAGHIRLLVGTLPRQAELSSLFGALQLEILDQPAAKGTR